MNRKVAYVGSSGSGKEGIAMEIRRIENEAQSQYILEPTKWLPVMAALHSGELERVEVPLVKPEVHGTLLEKLDLGQLLSDKEHDELKNTEMNFDIHFDGHEDALRAMAVIQNLIQPGQVLQVAEPSKLKASDFTTPTPLVSYFRNSCFFWQKFSENTKMR
jgi:hypothetical protein